MSTPTTTMTVDYLPPVPTTIVRHYVSCREMLFLSGSSFRVITTQTLWDDVEWSIWEDYKFSLLVSIGRVEKIVSYLKRRNNHCRVESRTKRDTEKLSIKWVQITVIYFTQEDRPNCLSSTDPYLLVIFILPGWRCVYERRYVHLLYLLS